MQIWIQRITLPISKEIRYEEPICKLVAEENISLWNKEWITNVGLKSAIDESKLIDQTTIEELEPVISLDEVELFMSRANEGYYR